MKKNFVKRLPEPGEIKVGDKLRSESFTKHAVTVTSIEKNGDFVTDEPDAHDDFGGSYYIIRKEKAIKLGKLFLCTRDIQVGDKVYSLLDGHCDDVEVSPFHPGVSWRTEGDFVSNTGWPDEPHTILDLEHSDYKPYRIRTDHGYGSPGRYIKVIGEVSLEAIWIKEEMEFDDPKPGFYMGDFQLLPVYKGDTRVTLLGSARQKSKLMESVEFGNLVEKYIALFRCPTCKTFH